LKRPRLNLSQLLNNPQTTIATMVMITMILAIPLKTAHLAPTSQLQKAL
jgi:hypothetical protein